jgi:hypothetical protein
MMSKVTRGTTKPTPMPPPVGKTPKGRAIGNFPDGVKPMRDGEKGYDPAPARPKGIR